MPRLALITLLVLGALLPATASASEGEYIVVSGGPALRLWEDYRTGDDQHDKWWGNFIRAARLRFEELRQEHGPDALITWLVYKPAYENRSSEDGRDLLELIRSVRMKYNISLVWFNSSTDFVHYLNAGHDRKSVKISGIEYFGHSNKHCWLFDYSCVVLGASKAWFHEIDIKRVQRGIFTRDPFIKSWGCHTGESMSRAWRSHTKTSMQGAIGKTDYSYLYEGKLPFISTPGGRWTD